MSKAITVYSQYFLQFLKARMSYRGDFFTGLIASTVVAFTGLAFVFLLIDGETVKSLRGWTRDEVLFIYGYSFMATSLFSLVAINLYSFGDRYVIQGQFDRVLLRPLGTLPQVLFESFNLESLGNFIVGILVIQTAKQSLGLTWGFGDYVWLGVSVLSGAIILISVFVILSSASFHFEDRLGIAPPFFNLLNFARYPLPIFNRPIQFLLSFVVPFGFVAFYPATHFFRRGGFEIFCYATPVVAILFSAIAGSLWRFGVSRYSSTGN